MIKVIYIILIMSLWISLSSQNAKTELKVYTGSEHKYSIKYPANWNIEKTTLGIVCIEPIDMKGGIYITEYSGITLTDHRIEDFILESNHLPDEYASEILKGEENGIKSWYISYTDTENHLTCISTYKKKGDYLLFISTEIEPEIWNNGWKEIITEIILSIDLK